MPGLVRWKGRIPAGSVSHRTTGFEDWLPTLLDLAGLENLIPKEIDGISFAPTLLGQTQPDRPFLYREFPAYGGQQCIREGQWKLIRTGLMPNRKTLAAGRKPTLELFDLSADPGEQHNLAGQNPDLVAHLLALMQAQHQPSQLFPFPALDP